MIIKSETANNCKLIQMIADEYSPLDMAKTFDVKPNSIFKRLERLREKYDKKTNTGLAILFLKNKLIK